MDFTNFSNDNYKQLEFTGLYFSKMCRKALTLANEYLKEKGEYPKHKLGNVWTRMGFKKPLGAYNDYLQLEEDGVDRFHSKKVMCWFDLYQ